MPTVADIIRHVEKLSGHALHTDEGVHHGSEHRRVRSAMVCWMATPDAIREAGNRNTDLLICHESLYYPYNAANREDNPEGWEDWRVNKQRRDLLTRNGLTCLRVHGSADEICVFDVFAATLGLEAPVYVDRLVKVYEIDECALGSLIERVKQACGMACVRVAMADGLDRVVHRVGLPWGGLGLFVNVGYQQRLVELGCDVFIAGEADNYGFRFAAECGIPMIETSHEISENPGLRRFADMLAEAFPDIAVHYYENPCVWECR